MIKLEIRGNPVPQGRPRFFRRGGFVGTYDPADSKSWKETIRWQAIEQRASLLEGAIAIRVTFYLLRPKSLPRKVQCHTKRPDVDNLCKGVLDSLRGICFKDDAQIAHLSAWKVYGEPPGVKVRIFSLSEGARQNRGAGKRADNDT